MVVSDLQSEEETNIEQAPEVPTDGEQSGLTLPDGLPSEPAEEVGQVSKPEDTIANEGTELLPPPRINIRAQWATKSRAKKSCSIK